jgi:hypothetical protein
LVRLASAGSIGALEELQPLQAAVKSIFGPSAGLSPEESRTPMPELSRQRLAKAEAAGQQISRRIDAQAATKADLLLKETVLKETVRIALASLADAVGFAFFSGALPRQNTGRSLGSRVDEDYFRSLVK